MPIGKNSIKRVANAGYSKVKTEAPDMENSTEVRVETVKPAAKKKAAAKAPAKKTVANKAAPVSNKKAQEAKKEPRANVVASHAATKFAVGEELPAYLL